MTMPSLQFASLRAAYRGGALRPGDVIDEVYNRIEAYPDDAVWISRFARDDVLARAEALDQADIEALPLFGIPFAVKDNIDVAGLSTTAACPDFAYAPENDATVVARLIAAGALPIGKTNLDQFATGLVGVRSPHGAPRCVFDDRYISGGSSSGSAVAVAAGLVSFALGTDTAGSGRVPAALNNIVGVKPTRGQLSIAGVVPACRSLDCVSVFAGNVSDADLVRRTAQGVDQADPYTVESPRYDLPSRGFRFGVLSARDRIFFDDDAASRLYDESVVRLSQLGGEPVEIDFTPFRDAAALLYDGPWVAERLAAISDFAAEHASSIHPVVRKIVLGGEKFSAVDAFEGQYRLEAFRRAAEEQWREIDLMCLPTCPTTYRVDAVEADPVALNSRLGTYTNFVNLLDYCAVAVPGGFRPDGLPLGVTLVGPAHTDESLAVIAGRLHAALGGFVGATEDPVASEPIPDAEVDNVSLLVVGAHMSGMPLNHQLVELGARLVCSATTASDYKLYALPDSSPPKPALIREPGSKGPGIAGEIWRMSSEAYGRFVAKIPSPLGIGTIELSDGETVQGFLGEAWAVSGATDITQFGGWRPYIEQFQP